ncbi:unnamed protein product, partial [Staurois parvus]
LVVCKFSVQASPRLNSVSLYLNGPDTIFIKTHPSRYSFRSVMACKISMSLHTEFALLGAWRYKVHVVLCC